MMLVVKIYNTYHKILKKFVLCVNWVIMPLLSWNRQFHDHCSYNVTSHTLWDKPPPTSRKYVKNK